MAASYNHSAIEKKWRENWAKNPINVDDGRKRNTTVWICSHIRQAAAFM